MIEWKTEPGLTDYKTAVSFMEQRVADIAAGHKNQLVWLVEHPPLYTAGTSAEASELLDSNSFDVYQTGRGGRYTYHGPGQRVGYMMLDLKKRGLDVHRFVFDVEQMVINALAAFNITAERRVGRVGIWVVDSKGRESKIGAIGVRIRKKITFHGFAVNINPDLTHFSGIVPCGLSQYGVTSMHSMGKTATMAEFDHALHKAFENVFGEKTQLV